MTMNPNIPNEAPGTPSLKLKHINSHLNSSKSKHELNHSCDHSSCTQMSQEGGRHVQFDPIEQMLKQKENNQVIRQSRVSKKL